MNFFDRVSEVIPHTGRAWIEAILIAAGLGVLVFVVLPRFVKSRVLRFAIAAGLLLVAGWVTVLPVFFDKKIDERLLGASSAAPTAASAATAPAPSPSPTIAPAAGPVKVTTGQLRGLAGHSGRGEVSVYRLPDASHFVRLEDIETPRAPAVYVYLVPQPTQKGPDGGVDLGPLKGNVGSQNYVVPAGIDVSKYSAVLLWCRRFSTPVAAAAQSPV